MAEPKPLPLGIQTFSDIIDGGFVYIDKTQYIYELVKNSKGVYFLSRPRRFGKSLLLDTLKEIFEGNKELFKGLWIYKSDYNWQKYPVIRMDFSKIKPSSSNELIESLKYNINVMAKDFQIELTAKNYADMFAELLRKLSKKGKVVVLIDEYDKLIIDNITNIEIASEFREILKGFYTVIKASDAYIRFVLLTGVSKFSKMSIFSGLNNLTDLTMDSKSAALVGITAEEIEIFFNDHIEELTKKLDLSKGELLNKIVRWYNGYKFAREGVKVINPYSFLSFLYHQDFQNFWFETGTPTFLIRLLQEKNYDLSNVVNKKIGIASFSSYEIGDLDIIPLLLQTGYLTIQDYNTERDLYTVDLPNYEVEHSFYEFLLEDYAHIDAGTSKSYIYDLVDAIEAGDVDGFMDILKVFYANIPYDIKIKSERYYQSMFFALFKLIGLHVETEVKTSDGRIDAVIEVGAYDNKPLQKTYIFEFKINGTAQEAMDQIKEKKYWEKYVKNEKCKVKNEKLGGALFNEKCKVKNEKLGGALFNEKCRVKNEKIVGQEDRKGLSYQLFLIGIGFDMEKKKVSEYLWEKV